MAGYLGSKRSSSLVSTKGITLEEVKLAASGDSITKSDGTTGVLSESSGVVTLNADSLQVNKDSTSGASGGLKIKTADSNESFITIGASTSLGRAFISSLQNGSGTQLPIDFITGSSSTNVRMRIDSSGNVGVGLGAPQEKLQVLGNIHALGSGSGNGTYGPYIAIGKANGPKISSTQENADDDIQGLAFFTKSSATGSNPPFEAMRINSSGNFKITNLGSGDVYATSGTLYISSDIRLKNDLGVINESGIEIIKQLTPRYYSWKDDENSRQQLGFFAQEVFPILPEAVPRDLKYEQNGVDENGEPILEQVLDENGEPDYQWGFATQPIVAMLVKAMQEQQALIESQQSQIDALTARIEALENQPT